MKWNAYVTIDGSSEPVDLNDYARMYAGNARQLYLEPRDSDQQVPCEIHWRPFHEEPVYVGLPVDFKVEARLRLVQSGRARNARQLSDNYTLRRGTNAFWMKHRCAIDRQRVMIEWDTSFRTFPREIPLYEGDCVCVEGVAGIVGRLKGDDRWWIVRVDGLVNELAEFYNMCDLVGEGG